MTIRSLSLLPFWTLVPSRLASRLETPMHKCKSMRPTPWNFGFVDLTKNWEQAKSPMAVLGVCVPELAQGALLAHWAVKYFDKERKPTAHDKAAYVHGFLKILSSKVDPVLARSGCNGFFAIPKNSAHKPHEDFAILHMPSANLSELLAQTQKVSNALGIIETSSGYAVRCRRQHWNDIRKTLLPDSPLPEEGVFHTRWFFV